MDTQRTILLRRSFLLPIAPKEQDSQREPIAIGHLGAVIKNIEGLGFIFNQEVIEVLKTWTLSEVGVLYEEILPVLRCMVGANREYTPFYPNFPRQVMELDFAEWYINKVFHYVGHSLGVLVLPKYEKEQKEPLDEEVKLRTIGLAPENKIHEVFQNLMGSKTSISQQDYRDLKWYFDTFKEKVQIPKEVPFKEILATVTTHALEYSIYIAHLYKTATDVLRLAVALSNGDVSLATPTKFRRFKRRERRLLLGILEECSRQGEIFQDMLRHRQKWVRLAHALHVGDYKHKFPKVWEAVTKIRSKESYPTFNTPIEKALKEKKPEEVLALLQRKPGELARRLDHLMRVSSNPSRVVEAFQEVAAKVSTPVLLQVRHHFLSRDAWSNVDRTFFPKGLVGKMQVVPNTRAPIAEDLCDSIACLCEDTLYNRFKELPPLGNVYIDALLVMYTIPFSQRSAQKTLRSISRGSRIPLKPLPGADTIRFFTWWKNGTDRTDIDLSVVFYDQDWKYLEHLSYTKERSLEFQAVHSGDVIDAPKGASEFVDIPIEHVKSKGVRYLVPSILSYSEQPYCDLPECFCGWMMREKPESGEIYEPKTVQQRIDLTANTRICIPAIFDLSAGNVIWADVALTKNPKTYTNVESNSLNLPKIGKAMVELDKPRLHDLLFLHTKARGTLVDSKEKADTVFSVDGDITPFDFDIIASQFL